MSGYLTVLGTFPASIEIRFSHLSVNAEHIDFCNHTIYKGQILDLYV